MTSPAAAAPRVDPTTALVSPTRARPWSRGVGAAIVVLAWAPAIVAAALLTAGDPAWATPLRVIVTALVYAPVAAVVITRNRRPAVAVILGALAVTSGWLALLVTLRSTAAVDGAALAGLLHDLLIWPRVAEVAALAVLPWLLASQRSRLRTCGIALGIATVVVDAAIATTAAVTGRPPGSAVLITLFASLALFVAGTSLLVGEWRRGTGPRREALAWLGLGGILLVLAYVPIVVDLPPPATTVGHALFVLASGVLPTALLAVVLGGEVGSDRRLLTASVWVQAIAVAVSLHLVVFEAALLAGLDRTAAGAAAAGALALVFTPVSRFVRRRTEAIVVGRATDARDLLRRLGEYLSDAPDPAAGLRDLAEALRATWSLDSVSIEPATGAGGGRAGRPGPESTSVELRASGRTVAVVEATAQDAALLHGSVRPALDEISGLVAVAVLLGDINQEVAETRRRMLGVRREERRMLHHELHDELAPSLAGIGYGMAAARRLVHVGSPGALDAVARLRHDVADRAEDVRLLARAQFPAPLDDGDLDAALVELARRSGSEEGSVTVRSSGADVLDDRTQLAVYLLAAEAVLRHRDLHQRGGISLDVAIDVTVVVVRFVLEPGAAGVVRSDSEAVDAAALLLDALAPRAAELGASLRPGAVEAGGARVVEAVVPR